MICLDEKNNDPKIVGRAPLFKKGWSGGQSVLETQWDLQILNVY